jgi:hypothetical protein
MMIATSVSPFVSIQSSSSSPSWYYCDGDDSDDGLQESSGRQSKYAWNLEICLGVSKLGACGIFMHNPRPACPASPVLVLKSHILLPSITISGG